MVVKFQSTDVLGVARGPKKGMEIFKLPSGLYQKKDAI